MTGSLEAEVGRREEDYQSWVTVTRIQPYTLNRFGRPIGIDRETQTFASKEEALRWITESPNYQHQIVLPFGGGERISARLEGPRYQGKQTLVVEGFGRKGRSPRTVEGHHCVSTNYEDFFDIVVRLGTHEDPVFERGITWINVENPRFQTLRTVLRANDYTAEQLGMILLRLEQRAEQVFQGLLNGVAPSDRDEANEDSPDKLCPPNASSLTVEDWHIATRTWPEFFKQLVSNARAMSLEERQREVETLLGHDYRTPEGENHARLIASVYNQTDETLDRIVQSFQ